MTRTCMYEGCDRRYFARGFCQVHYAALIRCRVNERRFELRRAYRDEWPLEWNDRKVFYGLFGPFPGPGHRLRKVDKTKPLSAENLRWFAPLPVTAKWREDISAYRRQAHQFRKYGLQPSDYDELLRKQRGGCAICNCNPVPPAQLGVDHDHQTGKVRGLLCHSCNSAIGHLDDSVEFLAAAIRYLLSDRAKNDNEAAA